MLKEIEILGYRVLNEDAAKVASYLCDDLDGRIGRSFIFLNPHSIVMAQHDRALKEAITSSFATFCDGVGLAVACRLLKRQRIQRVYGYEFFMALSRELARRRCGRVFFLGGTEQSVAELQAKYAAEFAGIEHIEAYAPPYRSEFSDAEVADMARRITACRTDILWIGLGSPKQEKMLPRLMQRCDVRCAAAVGAVFDFYIDKIPHAPPLVRRMGLQWAHRLLREPSRLWRRTFVSAPLFLSYVLKELIRAR